MVFFVEKGDNAIAAADDLARVFVRTVKSTYPQWVPQLLGMSSLMPPPPPSPSCLSRVSSEGSKHKFPHVFANHWRTDGPGMSQKAQGRAEPEVFRAGVPCPGTFTFDMIKHITRQTIHLVGGMVVAHGLPVRDF